MLYLSEENYRNYGFRWNVYDYKKLIPELKKKYPFLRDCPSQALQEAVRLLDNAYWITPTKSISKGNQISPSLKRKRTVVVFTFHKAGNLNTPVVNSVTLYSKVRNSTLKDKDSQENRGDS